MLYSLAAITGGVNSKNVCFVRKTQSVQGSEDFAGNRDTWKIFRELYEVTLAGSLRVLGNVCQIFGKIFLFSAGFYLHTVLLKQQLLELAPP